MLGGIEEKKKFDLPDATLERVAALRYEHGFVALLVLMEDYLASYLASVEDERDAGEALRKLRFWQNGKKLVAVLREYPQLIGEELESLGKKEDWEMQMWREPQGTGGTV